MKGRRWSADDRRRLLKVAKPVLEYANQLIAHRSETEEVKVTLGDVNRSVDDPRRLVTVDVPVRLGASLAEARRLTMEAASSVPQGEELAIYVQVGEITEHTAWLHVVAYAPFNADVSQVGSEIREQTVAALASADLLPA